jgi:hypothetical protein
VNDGDDLHRLALRITERGSAYEFSFEFQPVSSHRAPVAPGEHAQIASARGIVEHLEAPAALLILTNHYLHGSFLQMPRHRRAEYIPNSKDSPFLPHGLWQRVYTTPFDRVVRAQMSSPRSDAPYNFADALERLARRRPISFPERVSITYSI